MGVLFRNWNFARVARLIIGGSILIQGMVSREMLVLLFGASFTGMALFTSGCCGLSNCDTGINQSSNTHTYKDVNSMEVEFEEVKK